MSEASERAERILRSWSVLYDARKALRKRWREVWDVPIKNKHTQVLLEELAPGASVLEIGSSDRNLERPLKSAFPGLVYKSMDIDRETRHDFYSLDEVSEAFDAVLLFEVIEHVPFSEGVTLLARIYDLLEAGGKLIMTTPNLAHPTHYFRDPTHVTPWSHEGLGGVLLALGFEVDRLYRIYNAPIVQKVLRKYVACHAHRYFGVDFTHSLLVVARKPSV
jgi:SAM-dependent methyltransferase